MRCYAPRSIAFVAAKSHRKQRRWPWVVLIAVLAGGGCGGSNELNWEYGTRRGSGVKSLNGTVVLSDMFERAGSRVSSWRRLSPKLERDQVIVWFPDRFRSPYPEEVAFLNRWLAEKSHRTLVYVGRDYHAAADYWRELANKASAGQRLRIRRARAEAETQHLARRLREQHPASCDWLESHPAQSSTRVESLSGPWADGIVVADTQIWADTDVVLPGLPASTGAAEVNRDEDFADEEASLSSSVAWQTVPLLTGDGDRFLAGELRQPHWRSSKIIVIANGSFLLNYPLVNHQHRRLAARLVDSCAPASRVCFLESGPQPLGIADSDASVPMILRVFTVFPLNVLILQLLTAGLLYCFSVLPIFGRPASLPDDVTSDFGKHVTAVGEMLERGRHRDYASEQMKHFHELRNKATYE